MPRPPALRIRLGPARCRCDHADRGLALLGHPRTQPLLLLLQLGREFGAEVVGLEYLTDLDLPFLEGDALDPFDRLCLRLRLNQPEPGDELLRLGEGAVDDGTRLAGEFDACAFGAGMEAIEGESGCQPS